MCAPWLLIINKISVKRRCFSLTALFTEAVQTNVNTVSSCTIRRDNFIQLAVITLKTETFFNEVTALMPLELQMLLDDNKSFVRSNKKITRLASWKHFLLWKYLLLLSHTFLFMLFTVRALKDSLMMVRFILQLFKGTGVSFVGIQVVVQLLQIINISVGLIKK